MKKIFFFSLTLSILIYSIHAQTLKFDFGSGSVESGYTGIKSSQKYDSILGYGFSAKGELFDVKQKSKNRLTSDFVSGKDPFYFHVNVPEGNYRIKITLGAPDADSKATVKAESRRVMLTDVAIKKGDITTKSFTVNVRTPKINDTLSIRLNKREYPFLNWDNKLSLEFLGGNPCVAALEIEKTEDIKTVFLAGNSTVVDQEYVPWAAWGQVLPLFFNENIVVTNLAESGQAMKSFEWSNRLAKLLSMVKPGDYVFIQFGHNDQKPQSSAYLEANTTYKEYLEKFVNLVREKGGNPVLISSMHRRKFDDQGHIVQTHGDYPKAVGEVASELNVPFIDLNSMSKPLYESFGEEGSKKLFVHYAANTFPNQKKELGDNSHHSMFGATQLAKCIVQGIIDNNLELKDYLIDPDFSFNPSQPDKFEDFDIPRSSIFHGEKPLGN